MSQRPLVEKVTNDTDAEDGRSEGVAGRLGAAAEQLGQDLVVVL